MRLTQSTFTYTLTNYIYLITTTWKRSNKTEREINANWALCITCAVLCLFTLEAPIKTGCHFFFFFSKEMQDHANRWWKAVQTLCCLLYLVILNRLQADNCNVPICFWRLESWTATPLGSFLLFLFSPFISRPHVWPRGSCSQVHWDWCTLKLKILFCAKAAWLWTPPGWFKGQPRTSHDILWGTRRQYWNNQAGTQRNDGALAAVKAKASELSCCKLSN